MPTTCALTSARCVGDSTRAGDRRTSRRGALPRVARIVVGRAAQAMPGTPLSSRMTRPLVTTNAPIIHHELSS